MGSKHTKDEFSKRKRGIRKAESLGREKKIKKVTSSVGKIVIRKNKTRINWEIKSRADLMRRWTEIVRTNWKIAPIKSWSTKAKRSISIARKIDCRRNFDTK